MATSPVLSDTSDIWPAPTAAAPLDATVIVPGSKSLTNRALPLAAIAAEPTTIRGALRSRDADLMIGALRTLGTEISSSDHGATLEVRPGPLRGDVSIDCGLAGTVMRFVPPIAALADGPVHLDGDPGARVRPMGPVLRALAALGVPVTASGRAPSATDSTGRQDPDTVPQYLPVAVHGTGGIRGSEIDVDASTSSQFISGLLLAAPRFEAGLTLHHVGEVLPSQPHIDMTIAVLRERGVEVDDVAPGKWRVEPGEISGGDVLIEPDLSNAAPFLGAALAVGGSVSVPFWPSTTTQPGGLLPEILTRLGGTVELSDGVLTVHGTGSITPVDLDLSAAGELAPTVAALAALAPGESRLHGIAHLRGHETDRLAALVTEITRLGGIAEELEDGVWIRGGDLHGADVETYHDHRMATFAAMIGLAVPGVGVVNVGTTAKTLPDLPGMWHSMLGGGTH
ncbi:3-phosphoshikimate 1-carboxyvinyltransferase [Ruania alba]|uniref:3-phosphoshikimate 1-carboxyvinyltransferase n=1 Tax=Ruania alba TaxID=648782 RepID=A0A1H5NCZ2_9MICO|nr:3-phosphoshikimate 1-carboxyvinyltransferase [Ruania alba]SEE99415.1 3-phosphoshikimate 1-carboxyvinyltransferase [Ruania alba]